MPRLTRARYQPEALDPDPDEAVEPEPELAVPPVDPEAPDEVPELDGQPLPDEELLGDDCQLLEVPVSFDPDGCESVGVPLPVELELPLVVPLDDDDDEALPEPLEPLPLEEPPPPTVDLTTPPTV